MQQTCIKEAIRQEDYEGETPVHHAAAIGNIEVHQIIIGLNVILGGSYMKNFNQKFFHLIFFKNQFSHYKYFMIMISHYWS